MDTQQELTPTDTVIERIKQMLHSGELTPGMRLPAERKMAEQFGVGRTHIRSALQKLEFYGIIKTFPQSGSVVAELKIQALEGLISDVLKIEKYDFLSLVEMRVMLEVESIKLCALNRTEADIERIDNALEDYIEHYNDSAKVDKDFIFHRAIAQGGHNPVLSSMLLIITPDILRYYHQHHACIEHNQEVLNEHHKMLDCIRKHDYATAEGLMRHHLSNILQFSRENNEKNHFLTSYSD